ncbi:hypothetical protein D3C80_1735130 [compost metagenome]
MLTALQHQHPQQNPFRGPHGHTHTDLLNTLIYHIAHHRINTGSGQYYRDHAKQHKEVSDEMQPGGISGQTLI